MKLTFVGHAGFLAEEADVVLLTDPWLDGTVFNDSWSLYPKPKFEDDQWRKVTHIWISHEHPDHLNIPTIRAIPPNARKNITLLFQRHYDTLLLDWFQSQGFREVIELQHGKPTQLGAQFSITCYQEGLIDSGLLIEGEQTRILNLNDSQMPSSSLTRLKAEIGLIDVLFNQFSIAEWPGNPDDVSGRTKVAERVLNRFVRDFEEMEPRYLIPFASFVRFSHRENSFMNSGVNTVDDVAAVIPEERLVCLYPGDEWTVEDGQFPGSDAALKQYTSDWKAIADQELGESESVALPEVLNAINERIRDIQGCYHRFVLDRTVPVSFYMTDLSAAIWVNMKVGAHITELSEKECMVSLASQALLFTFSKRFGLPTLGVSGRYKINHSEDAFRRLKKLGSAYAAGFHSKGILKFFFSRRRLSFLWHRRRDLFSQFVQRTPGLSRRPEQSTSVPSEDLRDTP